MTSKLKSGKIDTSAICCTASNPDFFRHLIPCHHFHKRLELQNVLSLHCEHMVKVTICVITEESSYFCKRNLNV